MSRKVTKTRTEQQLELGRRLAVVSSVAHGMEIEVQVERPRGKNPGYVQIRTDINEVFSVMTEDRARRVTDNPLIYCESMSGGSPEYQNVVQALRLGCGIFFDWIDPNDVDRLAEEAAESERHFQEVNRAWRERPREYVVTRRRLVPDDIPARGYYPPAEVVNHARQAGATRWADAGRAGAYFLYRPNGEGWGKQVVLHQGDGWIFDEPWIVGNPAQDARELD